MGATVIGEELRGFIGSPVLMLVCVARPGGGPTIARGLGAQVHDDGEIDMMISRAQWPDAVAALRSGVRVATTFVRPSTYETYQVKGVVKWVAPTDEADRSSVRTYADSVLSMLTGLGLQRHQILAFLATDEPVRMRFAPTAAYLQTPGPGAGQPLASLA